MEEENDNIHYFYIFLLIISIILLLADLIEVYQLLIQWEIAMKMDTRVFHNCIQFQLFFKTAFCFFNLTVSAFTLILVGFLIKNTDFLVEKILPAIMEMVAIIFGPYLLTLCILGIMYWDKTVYTCEKGDPSKLKFVGTNCFNIIFFTIFSVLITFYKSISNAFYHIAFSVTKQNYPERSYVIKHMFWWVVFKFIRREDVVRHAIGLRAQDNPE